MFNFKTKQMKQFNLSEYLENPSREIVTRDGHPVRIICFNANIVDSDNIYPIVALIKKKDNTDYSASFTNNGVFNVGEENDIDLFFKSIQKEGWTNVYRNGNNAIVTDTVFETKEEALNKKSTIRYIDTVPIKWEE